MIPASGQVKYKYRKPGSNSWTHASTSISVNQPSETLVMQKLRDKHKGYDVELIELKFK